MKEECRREPETDDGDGSPLADWTADQVAEFVGTVEICKEYSQVGSHFFHIIDACTFFKYK